MLGLVVIAIIPAIGEELVFRGIVQNELLRWTKNAHISIWLAAIVFSTVHLQFYGFLPRVVLGAMFGYLYHWSGNLWLAMFAHFVNNAVQVVALFFYQRGNLQYDVEGTESVPANFIVIGTLLTAGLLYYFYKYFENKKTLTNQS